MKNIFISVLVFGLAFIGIALIIAATRIPNPNKVEDPVMLNVVPGYRFRQCTEGICLCHKYNGATTTIALHKVPYELHHKWETAPCKSEDDKYFMATSTATTTPVI